MTQHNLGERFWSKVNKTESCWEWTGAINHGYGVYRTGDGKTARPHRLAFMEARGYLPPLLDHACRNRKCLNPSHLRPATKSQNAQNLSGLRTDNTSSVRGVSWNKGANKWRAKGHLNNRQIHIGYFDSLEGAESAAKAWRIENYPYTNEEAA